MPAHIRHLQRGMKYRYMPIRLQCLSAIRPKLSKSFHNHFKSIYDSKNKASDILVLVYATKITKAIKQCSGTDCHTIDKNRKTKGVTSSQSSIYKEVGGEFTKHTSLPLNYLFSKQFTTSFSRSLGNTVKLTTVPPLEQPLQ